MKMLKSTVARIMRSIGLLAIVGMAGCGGDGVGDVQPGVLRVSLTDAPACGFEEVNITVGKVRVHQSSSASDNGAGWTDITLDPPRKINLLTLNDPTQPNLALETLGETPLPAGHYTQLRLVLVANNGANPLANSVVLEGQTEEITLATPSAIQSGIKLIHQFTVPPGQRVDLLLDFNACHSVVKTGSSAYILKPVIKVIPYELNGIEGFVDQALLGSDVHVSAQVNGEIVRSTRPNPNTGQFYLARLEAPADYDVVITADGHATAVIAGVPVSTSTSTTTVSMSTDPITLPSSAMRTVSGTVTLDPATDDETIIVDARQAFGSGPTVTVKSQNAMLAVDPPPGDSEYSLALPAGAPLLGQYSATLPIALDPQPAVAGLYAARASANGYASQSANVDISTDNVTQNFALTP